MFLESFDRGGDVLARVVFVKIKIFELNHNI